MGARRYATYPVRRARRPAPRGAGPDDPLQGRRSLAAVLVGLAVVLAVAALLTGWWTDSVTVTPTSGGSGETDVLAFNPGTGAQVTCTGSVGSSSYPFASYASPCNANFDWGYASNGLGGLEDVYLVVQMMVVLSVVLGAVSTLFMAMVATRRGWGSWHFHTTHLLALIAGVLAMLAPALLVLAQPGAIGSSSFGFTSPYYGYFLYPQSGRCGSNTPNETFWSSCTYTQGSLTYASAWGAGLGLYAAVAAAALLLLGGALFLSARPDEEDLRARGPVRGEGPLVLDAGGWAGAGPTGGDLFAGPAPLARDITPYDPGRALALSALDYRGAAAMEGRPRCRACGHLNPPASALCSRCHASLLG